MMAASRGMSEGERRAEREIEKEILLQCKIVRYFLAKRRDNECPLPDINQGSNEPTDYESRLETSADIWGVIAAWSSQSQTQFGKNNTSKLKHVWDALPT